MLLEWSRDGGDQGVPLCRVHAEEALGEEEGEAPRVLPKSSMPAKLRMVTALKGAALEAMRPEIEAFERKVDRAKRRASSLVEQAMSLMEALTGK
jgi:hypothetical protein